MILVADFHIHSKYSRACSRDLVLSKIDETCRVKGVDIIGIGDFTFPAWIKSIQEELEEIKSTSSQLSSCKEEGVGLYKLKVVEDDNVKFILTTELALIYRDKERARRIHIVVHAPNIEAVLELNRQLDKDFNIRSDGRPILGMSVPDLMRLCFSIHPDFLIYPAHIWTPWFSVFGSKSGFDSFEECFQEFSNQVFAYETGLSSDPEMNWRLSTLDKYTLLSNSDAHSLENIGREANVFDLETVSFESINNSIKQKKNLLYTIEFYPEEGMYHYDGHRSCGIRFSSKETKKNKGICPRCKKPLVIGVENRVDELADRVMGYKPEKAPVFKKLVELDKIIAESLNLKSRKSKKVQAIYEGLVRELGTELDILMNIDINKIEKASSAILADGISRMRDGKIIVEPGYDGEYGVVRIFSEEEKIEHKKRI